MTENRPEIAWHISTYSDSQGGNCVEAGPLLDGSGRVAVRHSRHPDGAMIVYTRPEWTTFLTAARNGEFDL
ncbi:DUF397 domain-containing protein [Plantactinospora sp. CA-294935]|uniref:DUF397 domain-containing protein n=1 Tax=Plantactinospora sp. CA-294935 TaxID=3240012 RepID=UPI003D915E4F